MSEKDLAEYRKIVGDIDYGEYMGAEFRVHKSRSKHF